MPFGFRRPFQAKGRDRFIVNMDAEERAVVKAVCEDVLAALDDGDANPLMRRVFPVAHVSDAEINQAYRDLVHSDLLRTRRELLQATAESAESTELDRQTLEQWMVALNVVRLVLGTRLDVTEGAYPDLTADDPDLPAWALYEFLGGVVENIVRALAGTL